MAARISCWYTLNRLEAMIASRDVLKARSPFRESVKEVVIIDRATLTPHVVVAAVLLAVGGSRTSRGTRRGGPHHSALATRPARTDLRDVLDARGESIVRPEVT